MRHRRVIRILFCLLIAAIGCGKSEIYSDLSQQDANDIMVLLTKEQVDVELEKTTRQNRTSFSVMVEPGDVDRARELLQERNLPRVKSPGLREVFSKDSFIQTPQEIKARFLFGTKGDIINSLLMIPDVVDADVNLTMPTEEQFGADVEQERPSASVVLKVRPTQQALGTLTEDKVQRFVANSVERLDPRDVSVILTYIGESEGQGSRAHGIILPTVPKDSASKKAKAGAAPSGDVISIAGLSVQTGSAARLKLYLGLFLGLLAMLSLGLVVMVVQASRMREQIAEQELPALEGEIAGEGPPQLEAGGE